jgi:RNA 2',3'-cyclic 3'-phosphodiesterase
VILSERKENLAANVRRMSIRAFISISLDPELKEVLVKIQRQLQAASGRGAIRWTPIDQLHLTLRFLGNVDEERLPQLGRALESACLNVQSFTLSIADLGCFPSIQRPKVIWAGIQGDLVRLRDLQEKISREAASFASHFEEREFHPHLTIGRVKDRSGPLRDFSDAVRQASGLRLGQWTVTGVDLMQSKLSPQGSIYTQLQRIPLLAK